MRELIGNKFIISDGAMGTMMQRCGLETGQLPETLNFTDPDMIEGIHAAYLEAGSDFVSTNTFGGNSKKLAGSGYTGAQVAAKAVSIARKAASSHEARFGGRKYVALDIGPIGQLMEPAGKLTFEEAYSLFREQVEAGVESGADAIFFETFSDIYEMKAAVLAAKESCDLPVFCSVTFQEDGRMLMGTDPLTMVCILQDLGIDALGVNCSLGPAQMIPIVQEILACSRIPVLVQPNAGLPVIREGQTVYDVTVDEFADIMAEIAAAGAAILGGCCGTDPEYIRKMAARIRKIEAEGAMPACSKKRLTAACSATRTVLLDGRIRIIGERINPTGKKLLKEALRAEDITYIQDEAIRQVKAGAEILDINVGLPEIDERQMMLRAVKSVASVVDTPLQIDSSDPAVIEAAARAYNGKPIINSVNGKESVMREIFPIVKKYGASVIALTLDDSGLPKDAAQRIAIAGRIIEEAEAWGIGRERIIVDCLTLTVSAEQHAALDTLKAIRAIKEKYGVRTTLGASNVSFGLPERKLLNRTFLAMAMEAGLDAPITDPLEPEYINTIRAFEALSAKDRESRDYIAAYGARQPVGAGAGEAQRSAPTGSGAAMELTLENMIVEGYPDRAGAAAAELLKTLQPLEVVEQRIIPSLEIVGRMYEKGELFLPQLIKSADTVTKAFEVIKAAITERGGASISYGRIILATVKGDIHDIGKNIVKVLLENYGYDVIDLGKDVPIETVVSTALREDIKLVGLSALMTTTVVNMEATIRALKEAGCDCRIVVGGAVLTADYAVKIGADYFGKDAMATVKAANEVFKVGASR